MENKENKLNSTKSEKKETLKKITSKNIDMTKTEDKKTTKSITKNETKVPNKKTEKVTKDNLKTKTQDTKINKVNKTNLTASSQNAKKENSSNKTIKSTNNLQTEKKIENGINRPEIMENKNSKEENNKIKVLYVVSECHPFCATGGLADVAEGLPKFINQNSNIDMRVVLPMYSDIPSEYRDNFKFLGYKYIPVAWRNIYCGVFTYSLNGVTYYFLDNEYYLYYSSY